MLMLGCPLISNINGTGKETINSRRASDVLKVNVSKRGLVLAVAWL